MLFEEGDVVEKKSNNEDAKGNRRLKVGIKPVDLRMFLCVFHTRTVCLIVTAIAKENIANTISIVNQTRLMRFGGLARAEMINVAPNHPAEILINQSEAARRKSVSIFMLTVLYQNDERGAIV